ncbi:MAG: tetratricopeptide repeat protein [Myxococcota bacterium]
MRSFLLVLTCLGAAEVAAESTLHRAETALEELELEQAEKLFRKALEVPASREERVTAYRGLGLALAFQGKTNEAVEALEKLLLIDPKAEIDRSLGPKVTEPFGQAQRNVAGKKNELSVQRKKTGELFIELREDVPLAEEVTVHARTGAHGAFTPLTAAVGAPLMMSFAEEKDVQVFAEAVDANGGVLYQVASRQRPLQLPAPVAKKEVPAVRNLTRKEPRLEQRPPSEDSSWWPILVGTGVVIGAGLAAAAVITQPPPLKLPPADRTSGLP